MVLLPHLHVEAPNVTDRLGNFAFVLLCPSSLTDTFFSLFQEQKGETQQLCGKLLFTLPFNYDKIEIVNFRIGTQSKKLK